MQHQSLQHNQESGTKDEAAGSLREAMALYYKDEVLPKVCLRFPLKNRYLGLQGIEASDARKSPKPAANSKVL